MGLSTMGHCMQLLIPSDARVYPRKQAFQNSSKRLKLVQGNLFQKRRKTLLNRRLYARRIQAQLGQEFDWISVLGEHIANAQN